MFDNLKNTMSAAGVNPANAPLIADGKLRRFRLPEDRPQSKNGYITLFDNGDGSYGASFGSWKQGIRDTWFSGKPHRELSSAEHRESAQRMAEQRRKQAEEQHQRHTAAANRAQRLWQGAQPASPKHPYLIKKQVQPHGIRQMKDSLIVPVCDGSRKLNGLQFIDRAGGKRFLSGTAVAGAYYPIGPAPGDVLLLAEGFATAATLFEATGYPCVVAFFAGNLKPVALVLRGLYPKVQILICADADPVGRAAAIEAASAVDGAWIEPDFSESESRQ